MPVKVIQQLAQHFWDQGALSPNQVDYLVVHGYVDEDVFDNYQIGTTDQPVALASEDNLEQLEDRLNQVRSKTAKRGKKRAGQPAGQSATKLLCERIGAELALRAEECSELMAAEDKRPTSGKSTHEDFLPIATRLRAVLCFNCYSAVNMIGLNPHLLQTIWRAVELAPIRDILADRRLRAPATNALRVLLSVPNRNERGPYNWILKHAPLRMVAEICDCRRALLSVLRTMHQHYFQQLHIAVACRVDPTLFWANVLIYNARQVSAGQSSFANQGNPGRHYALLLRPDWNLWLAAIELAKEIDGENMNHWITERFPDKEFPHRRSLQCEAQLIAITHLDCPHGWHAAAHV